MALGKSHWSKYGNECTVCFTRDNLTRHHIKLNGKRTGKIIVLCLDCHKKEDKK